MKGIKPLKYIPFLVIEHGNYCYDFYDKKTSSHIAQLFFARYQLVIIHNLSKRLDINYAMNDKFNCDTYFDIHNLEQAKQIVYKHYERYKTT